MRTFLDDRGLIEVTTPVIGRTSITDPAIESIAVPGHGFLQTSPEYFLKRLLAAGAPSLYQLGPVFRAEERGRLHHTEFTLLEWYRLGFDHDALMKEVAALVEAVLGPGETRTIRYAELTAGRSEPEESLRFDAATRNLDGRWFITEYPAEQAALARLLPGGEVAARFELVIDGVEIANGYHELGDADELLARFEADNFARQRNGAPVVPIDDAFVAAMRHGMPDCAGVALGIDRLVMLATGATSLDEVIPFRD